CVMFRETASIHKNMLQYIKKGTRLNISGSINKIDTYQNKHGENKASVNFIVALIQFLPKAKSDDQINKMDMQPEKGKTYPLHTKEDEEALNAFSNL
ncbi:hypothetical protein MHBO_004938, partial [Bonamia ostreae]